MSHNDRRVIRGDGVVFKSAAEAARAVFGFRANICAACRGRIRTAYGYTWKYADEQPTPKRVFSLDDLQHIPEL